MCVVMKKEGDMATQAGKRFVAKMKDRDFVVALLRGYGVNRPPCFCCLHPIKRTCPDVVKDFDCVHYVLYSESPPKVERKFLTYIVLSSLPG